MVSSVAAVISIEELLDSSCFGHFLLLFLLPFIANILSNLFFLPPVTYCFSSLSPSLSSPPGLSLFAMQGLRQAGLFG
jgi:hypothetical protein